MVYLTFCVDVTPLEYVSFNGHHQLRRPSLAAFLIAYGASFVNLRNRRGSALQCGMSLLEQELTRVTSDCIILRAIVKTLPQLPTLETLGISVDRPPASAAMMHLVHHPPPPGFEAAADNLAVQRSAFIHRCNWYQRLASSPRTLQHHCRVVVRNQLGPSRLRAVSSLPLPVPLRDYLLLEHDEYR